MSKQVSLEPLTDRFNSPSQCARACVCARARALQSFKGSWTLRSSFLIGAMISALHWLVWSPESVTFPCSWALLWFYYATALALRLMAVSRLAISLFRLLYQQRLCVKAWAFHYGAAVYSFLSVAEALKSYTDPKTPSITELLQGLYIECSFVYTSYTHWTMTAQCL